MSILNFVDQDQLDELNEDPKIAFMELVNFAQRSLHDQTKPLDEDERGDWQKIEDLRLEASRVFRRLFGLTQAAISRVSRAA